MMPKLVERLLGSRTQPRFEVRRATSLSAALPIAQGGAVRPRAARSVATDSLGLASLRELAAGRAARADRRLDRA